MPVRGYGAGRLDIPGNHPGYVDRMVFGGLLSTFPAATTCLFGVLAALIWRRSPERAPLMLAIFGGGLIVLGLLVNPISVINKRIWTSSFALLSSGVAAVALAALAIAARSTAATQVLIPLRILGGNAIVAFIVATLFGRVYGAPLIGSGEARASPAAWLDHALLRVVGDPYAASFTCAVAVLALITLLVWPLHRRAIHFRL